MNEESKVSCLIRGSKMNYFFVFNRSEIKGCCGTPLPQPSLSVPPQLHLASLAFGFISHLANTELATVEGFTRVHLE